MTRKRPKEEHVPTLSEVYGFKSESYSSFKIGDLVDLQDDWGPGMIHDLILDQEAEEWKYKVSFPKNKQKKWFYEKKMKYFIQINQMKVFSIKKNEKEIL